MPTWEHFGTSQSKRPAIGQESPLPQAVRLRLGLPSSVRKSFLLAIQTCRPPKRHFTTALKRYRGKRRWAAVTNQVREATIGLPSIWVMHPLALACGQPQRGGKKLAQDVSPGKS